MTEFNQPPSSKEPVAPSAPLPFFKDSGIALKELRKLEPPFTDEMRAAFLEKVAKSPMAKPIAFTLLALGWTGKTDARWNLIRSGVRQLLLGDREYPGGSHLGETRARRAWLASEFNTDHRSAAAKSYVADFNYLRPLYIILNEPDNEGWLDAALADFIIELDGAIEVAQDAGPKKASAKLTAARQLAWQISRQVPTKPNGHKSLRTHLHLLQAFTALHLEKGEKLESANQQVDTLDRLLTEARVEVARLHAEVERAQAQIVEERARAEAIAKELRVSRDQQSLQKGVADAKLSDELNAQRAAVRAYLRERIQNVRLYADRPEPARDKIARLCEEMVAFLDDPTRAHK